MGSTNVDIEHKELSPTPLNSGYLLMAPDGRRIAVPKELFDSVNKFRVERATGHIELQFKTGGIAGISGTNKYTFK